ncbi:MAG: hypothetical protein QXW97_02275 [Candidatus Pacearchaeota archaeon]
MLKKRDILKRPIFAGVIVGFIIFIIILGIVLIQLNKSPSFVLSNNTSQNNFDLSNEIKSILDDKIQEQKSLGIIFSYSDFRIEENNVYFILNCSDKLSYQKEHAFIHSLAIAFFEKLPDIYGKNTKIQPAPKIEIISGANCQYREGFLISNGYMGTKLI